MSKRGSRCPDCDGPHGRGYYLCENPFPEPEPPARVYDECAGIIPGPFEGCECTGHHQHGPNGTAGCPVCSP